MGIISKNMNSSILVAAKGDYHIDSKINQHKWNAKQHSKKNVEFTYSVYTETITTLNVNGKSIEKIEKLSPSLKCVFLSNNNFFTCSDSQFGTDIQTNNDSP